MSAVFKGKWKCLRIGFVQTFCTWKCKENTGQCGYKWFSVVMRWSKNWMVVWASVALSHPWGRKGHHSSGYVFQPHHSSCAKINLIRSSLIFLTTGKRGSKFTEEHVGGISSGGISEGGLWLQGSCLTLLGLINPFDSGGVVPQSCFSQSWSVSVGFHIFIPVCFIPPMPHFASRISLAGQAG